MKTNTSFCCKLLLFLSKDFVNRFSSSKISPNESLQLIHKKGDPLKQTLRFTSQILLILSVGFSLQAQSLDNDLPRLRSVNSFILRGGRPTAQGLTLLAQKGIKTIINLESSKSAVQFEKQNLRTSGIHLITVPMDSFSTPKDSQVKAILDALNDPKNYPIYIHCQHGEDRTGLIVGLYRVEHGMSAADAYHEMLSLGFHKILLPLNHYFETKTNFED